MQTSEENWFVCLFVCLFVCGFKSHTRIIYSYGDATTTSEGLQILTYARHSWQLSSYGSLACHTHCDTGHPFIMIISEYPWHPHLMPSVWQWSCHYLLLRLRSVATGIRTRDLPHARCTFLPTAPPHRLQQIEICLHIYKVSIKDGWK